MNDREYMLTVLVEECSEVAQRACKAIRFGISEVQPGQGEDNKRRLERELADLMETADQLGLVVRDKDKAAKRAKLKEFMDYSRKIGILDSYSAIATHNEPLPAGWDRSPKGCWEQHPDTREICQLPPDGHKVHKRDDMTGVRLICWEKKEA